MATTNPAVTPAATNNTTTVSEGVNEDTLVLITIITVGVGAMVLIGLVAYCCARWRRKRRFMEEHGPDYKEVRRRMKEQDVTDEYGKVQGSVRGNAGATSGRSLGNVEASLQISGIEIAPLSRQRETVTDELSEPLVDDGGDSTDSDVGYATFTVARLNMPAEMVFDSTVTTADVAARRKHTTQHRTQNAMRKMIISSPVRPYNSVKLGALAPSTPHVAAAHRGTDRDDVLLKYAPH